MPVEPIKDGEECGAPAPVQLISIGKSPQVALSPPAIVTCDMVAGLGQWLNQELQPLARKHLGSPIIKIETMSSYSCRNAYGRTKTRLSEHGRANALDIRGFMTASAQPVDLLADWGMTRREIAAQVAAVKAAAEKAAAEKAAAAMAARPPVPGGQPAQSPATVAQPAPIPGGGPGTLIEGLPRVRVTIPGTAPAPSSSSGLGLSPSRLGGPVPALDGPGLPLQPVAGQPQQPAQGDRKTGRSKSAPSGNAASTAPQHLPQAAQHTQDRKSLFLRAAHGGGCRIFGTILGPEANNAHRNHFHVDMAERRSGSFCE